jgi:transposase
LSTDGQVLQSHLNLKLTDIGDSRGSSKGGIYDRKEQQRVIKRRLAILQHADEFTGNVAATCRYFGISRQCFYTWLKRYEEEGEEGLRERSRRPLTSPRATHAEVVGKIIYLRSPYHQGPLKISMYLKRYHDVDISASGVWRILKKLDMSRLPTSQGAAAGLLDI